MNEKELKAYKEGKQSVINYVTEILYNANISDNEALTEIMKYCDVYNGGNNDE